MLGERSSANSIGRCPVSNSHVYANAFSSLNTLPTYRPTTYLPPIENLLQENGLAAIDLQFLLAYLASSLPLLNESPVDGHYQAFAPWPPEQRAMGSLRQPASIGVSRDMWGAFTA